jgi:hypothetical protein
LPFFVEDFALKNGLKVLQPEKLRWNEVFLKNWGN